MIRNETINTLLTRRSIRKFASEQITDEELDTVLEAGLYAPSARAQQPWLFVVVQDKATRKEVVDLNNVILGSKSDPYYNAPTIIIVFSQKGAIAPVEDASLAMGNIFNAAHAIGLASCWINREREMFQTAKGKELMKRWGVADDYFAIGACAIGKADCEMPKAGQRREGRVIKIK